MYKLQLPDSFMLFYHLGYPLHHLSLSILPIHALCLEHGPGCSLASYPLFIWLWHHRPLICLSSLHPCQVFVCLLSRGLCLRDLMLDDFRWSCCNNKSEVHIKCYALELYLNHPPAHGPWKIVFHETNPWCQKG